MNHEKRKIPYIFFFHDIHFSNTEHFDVFFLHGTRGLNTDKKYYIENCPQFLHEPRLTGLMPESGLICKVYTSSREYWNRP